MGRIQAALALRRAVNTATSRPKVRKALLIAGICLFVAMAIGSFAALPERPNNLSWPSLGAVLVVFGPLTVLLSAVEYRQTAALAGQTTSMASAMQIAVASSAANLLPIPGSFLVRSSALRKGGASKGTAVVAPAGVGLTWLAVGTVFTGGWLAATEPSLFSLALLVAGFVLSVIAIELFRSMDSAVRPSQIVQVWLTETAMTVVSALRYLLVLWGLGVDGSLGQSFALALSSIIATALGVMPAGLGLREALAGLLAPFVALSVSVGVLAAVANRIIGLLSLGAVAAGLAIRPIEHEQMPADV